MDDRYGLKFTPIAEDDLDSIFQYIGDELSAPQAADDLMDEIERQTMRLRDFPYSGSLVSDDILGGKGYRKLVIKNYIVFHLIDESEKQVVIMRILYGARNYENLL